MATDGICIFINVEAATESICHSMRHSHGSGDGHAILSQTLAKTSDTVFPYLLPLILHRLLASAMNVMVVCPVGSDEKCVTVRTSRSQSVRAFRRNVINALSMGAAVDSFGLENFDLFVWLDDDGLWEVMSEYRMQPLFRNGRKHKLRTMASYNVRADQVLVFRRRYVRF